MVPLGMWMMRRVFTQCRDWPACDISINLSPLQIMAQGFVETIAGLVDETGIDPHRVILEVTEGVMLDRSEHVAHLLRTLQSMGFRIALDDFGIGYSSLSYLRRSSSTGSRSTVRSCRTSRPIMMPSRS
jgi:EAL domain-containing protein (putative c-di-GMP-specific phosphodiesterase class I)